VVDIWPLTFVQCCYHHLQCRQSLHIVSGDNLLCPICMTL
jgi:hypothetical protein